ncbi:MAG TPA: hypothetical protein VF482_12445, partial [Trebonia sp.]
MTKTEERLRDYLGAVADSVRPDNTRPLVPPDTRKRSQRAAKGGGGHRGWRVWAVPLAAAASVVAVVSVTAAVGGHVAAHRASSSRTGTTAPPLRYYVEVESGTYETD